MITMIKIAAAVEPSKVSWKQNKIDCLTIVLLLYVPIVKVCSKFSKHCKHNYTYNFMVCLDSPVQLVLAVREFFSVTGSTSIYFSLGPFCVNRLVISPVKNTFQETVTMLLYQDRQNNVRECADKCLDILDMNFAAIFF